MENPCGCRRLAAVVYRLVIAPKSDGRPRKIPAACRFFDCMSFLSVCHRPARRSRQTPAANHNIPVCGLWWVAGYKGNPSSLWRIPLRCHRRDSSPPDRAVPPASYGGKYNAEWCVNTSGWPRWGHLRSCEWGSSDCKTDVPRPSQLCGSVNSNHSWARRAPSPDTAWRDRAHCGTETECACRFVWVVRAADSWANLLYSANRFFFFPKCLSR